LGWEDALKIKLRATAFLVGVPVLLLLGGCREIPTSVKVGSGPKFSLEGSGRLASFTIYALQSGQKIAFPDHDVAAVIWQVAASKGYFKGSRVKGLQLTYGKVPSGYEQVVPGQLQAAPALASGTVYAFFAESTDAPIASGYFYMGESGPVQTAIPDLCVMFVQGHKVRVKCKLNTAEPYQEPVDLEKYVREHQVP
jgi:hypothetical protein